MIRAILKEIQLRENYLNNLPISTIYFGGGTPSLLSGEIMEDIYQHVEQGREQARLNDNIRIGCLHGS
jgi:oxygen-independent coproporphyrinogen-3 oxidase